MIHFSNRQLLRAHRFVLEMHAAGTVERLKRLIPDGLSSLIASDRVSFNELAGTRVRVVPSPVPSWWTRLGQVYQQNMLDHPLWQDTSRMCRVVGFEDRGLGTDWKNSLLYQEYFVPLGIKHQISSLVYKQNSEYIGLAVNRCRRDFGTADRILLELLAPHIGRAWHNTLALAAAQQRKQETTRAHTSECSSVVLLEPRGGVIRDLSIDAVRPRGSGRSMFGTADTSRPPLPPSLTNIERPDPVRLSVKLRPGIEPKSAGQGPSLCVELKPALTSPRSLLPSAGSLRRSANGVTACFVSWSAVRGMSVEVAGGPDGVCLLLHVSCATAIRWERPYSVPTADAVSKVRPPRRTAAAG